MEGVTCNEKYEDNAVYFHCDCGTVMTPTDDDELYVECVNCGVKFRILWEEVD